MIEIPLSSRKYPGLVALVDDEDADLIAGYSWCPSKPRSSRTFYAVAYVPGSKHSGRVGKTIQMHQLIMDAHGRKVDHANRNGLDNRRENLRFGTDSQHAANQGISVRNTSGYKGVSPHSDGDKWVAKIQADGQFHYLGRYGTAEEAARVYDAASRELHGDRARLNFPDERAAA